MNPCKVSRKRHKGIVKSKSVPLKTMGSTEMPLTLDYVNIAALIMRKPTVLFVKSKFLRLSVMTLSGKIVTKQFPCSQDGKHDIQAIEQIQSFVHSANAVIWLKGYISSVTSKGDKQSISGLVTCNDWPNCLVSARITFELQKYLRLICILKCGHQKSKYFHCSLSGKKDLNAITEIQNFVDGESFNDWLKYVNYVHIGTVPTGIACRRYLDKILFDKRIRIRQSKNVSLTIKRDEDILFVSNVARQDKKQFHRTDDRFIPIESGDLETFGIKTAVVMNVLCSSRTSVCRNKCGCIIKDMSPSLTECLKCNASLISYNQCINCETLHTSEWRTLNGQKQCNACYLYNITHKSHRVESMFSHHMGPPNVHPHMLCGWKLKLIIKMDDLENWDIFENEQNSIFHPLEPTQIDRHMSQSMKHKIDRARMTGKTAPSQIYIAENPTSILTHGDTAIPTKSINLRQISNRCYLIDRHYLGNDLSGFKHKLTNSDWRNAEIILETHFESVLMFQRGNAQMNRNYYIVLGNNENLGCLEEFGMICGYDIKHDLNAARFKTSILTYCESANRGRIGMAAISNCEISKVHKMNLEITMANMPCRDSNCVHEQYLYIFDDNNGFFHLRPCTLLNGSTFQPVVQHDKAWDIKTACGDLSLNSDLCNFHTLKALKEEIMSYPDLKIVINPVLTALKGVMRSWHETVRTSLVHSFFNFLNNCIPQYVVSVRTKNSFARYLNMYWFQCAWKTTFTAEVAFLVPEQERRNPLLLTNNITENQFRLIVQGENANHLNKSIALQVQTLIDRTLPRHAHDTVHGATSLAKFQNQVNTSKGKLLKDIMKGIDLVKAGKVMLVENWEQHGWLFITSEDQQSEMIMIIL